MTLKHQRRKRPITEGFNLSFLDVISCGFGAVILLLVLSRFAEPLTIEERRKDLEKKIIQLTEQLSQLNGETRILNQSVQHQQQQLADEQARLARLQGERAAIKGAHQSGQQGSQVSTLIEDNLLLAQQKLNAALKRLQRQGFSQTPGGNIGGLPVDSEYIIFIIDTSGSMLHYSWNLVLEKMQETLAVYPKVKGIQVMNDMGQYLFSQYQGKWIPDSPARRKAIIKRLNNWQSFSNSSPVEGIVRAIKTFHAMDKKISLYVFGDEFTGPSIEQVLNQVDRINSIDQQGNRRVRIHAVGFPVALVQKPEFQITGIRFATLMRILCFRNDGVFIGLNQY